MSDSTVPNILAAMPSGAKLWMLDLGQVDCDASMLVSGSNLFPPGLPPQQHERRDMIMISVLVLHPDIGLILFDTGSCEDIVANWPAATVQGTPRTWDKKVHSLPAAIEATGAGTIKDIKAVVLSHLHLDHAGGLEHFLNTDVEIWCHEDELKYAFWSAATGIDRHFYVPHYLVPDQLNWKTFGSATFAIWPGVTLHHVPGHTCGSIMMELALQTTGAVLLTGDLFHVRENWEDGIPQAGALMRDYTAWTRSAQFARHLAKSKGATVVLGHETKYFRALPASPAYID